MAKKKAEETVKKETVKNEKIDIDSLKKELNIYIDETIRKSINLELEKSYKRTIRDKNIKIIIKNMVITVLLLIIVYLVYVLNDNDYFDKFFVEESSRKATETVKKEEDNSSSLVEEKKEPTLDDLKREYAYLLDNIFINEDSIYVKDYYDGRLTNGLKNYLTMNLMDIDSLTREEDYNVIENDEFKQCFEKKFISDYIGQTFNYNGNVFRYINKMDSYITEEIVKENTTNIKRVITDIKVDKDEIIISTVEGLVKEDKLYNIISNDEVSEYNEDNMLKNKDKLNKMVYTFDRNDKLLKLGK